MIFLKGWGCSRYNWPATLLLCCFIALRHYTPQFGNKIASLLERLKPRTDYVADNPRVDAVALFETWSWGDMWNDADMLSLIHYLYGAKALRIPPNWKSVLPREI